MPATNQSGVIVHDPVLAHSGYNLITSGHAPEAILMDMNGITLHTWRCELQTVWPDYRRPEHVREAAEHSWRRAYLYPNGDLLAVFEGIALIKLDSNSNLLWTYRRGCHHDVSVSGSGEIFVLTSEMREGLLDNGIAILNPNGTELRHISLLDCLQNSPYAPLTDFMPESGDVLHTNSVKLLDDAQVRRNPAFRQGNVLVSFRTLNTVAVVDLDASTVTWAMTGQFRAQHEPTLLANGNLLVFDNQGAGEHSRVLEIDPAIQQVVWRYPPGDNLSFYTRWCGIAARLPNGNTLITETDNGRAFEVTPDHKIAWEYINPNQFEEQDVRMVAALFEVVRVPQIPEPLQKVLK